MEVAFSSGDWGYRLGAWSDGALEVVQRQRPADSHVGSSAAAQTAGSAWRFGASNCLCALHLVCWRAFGGVVLSGRAGWGENIGLQKRGLARFLAIHRVFVLVR